MDKPAHAHHIPPSEWDDMDEATQEFLAVRRRPGVWKTDMQPDGSQIRVRNGWCPCPVCGHTYMHECEPGPGPKDMGCLCCHRLCT